MAIEIDTPYVALGARVLVNADDADDLAAVAAIQESRTSSLPRRAGVDFPNTRPSTPSKTHIFPAARTR
jgi:hypothetical protein